MRIGAEINSGNTHNVGGTPPSSPRTPSPTNTRRRTRMSGDRIHVQGDEAPPEGITPEVKEAIERQERERSESQPEHANGQTGKEKPLTPELEAAIQKQVDAVLAASAKGLKGNEKGLTPDIEKYIKERSDARRNLIVCLIGIGVSGVSGAAAIAGLVGFRQMTRPCPNAMHECDIPMPPKELASLYPREYEYELLQAQGMLRIVKQLERAQLSNTNKNRALSSWLYAVSGPASILLGIGSTIFTAKAMMTLRNAKPAGYTEYVKTQQEEKLAEKHGAKFTSLVR